ncbi:hemerythrin domain-containing protein [Salinactinospora qingdaonensis]|uniref:Hemerythrin-like domain-containing protein n=1 Tax=Salinactinospora qingdaonensis TaxID=702744 RepID=A0ABP7EXY7_9ACTN
MTDVDPAATRREEAIVRADGSLDDTTRPRVSNGEGRYQAGEAGQRLVRIHDHLREELRQLQDAFERVMAGHSDPAVARSMINQLTMRQNYWTLGSFCASYCRVLATHHTIEDEHMFVHLKAAQETLAPVLGRLEQEHEIIAAALSRLDAALVEMIQDPARLDGVHRAVELLADMLLSHLDYEESELVAPIDRLGLQI